MGSVLLVYYLSILPLESNDLGKAVMREVISFAAPLVCSGMLVFSKDLSCAVFRGFGIMVLEGGVIMVLYTLVL